MLMRCRAPSSPSSSPCFISFRELQAYSTSQSRELHPIPCRPGACSAPPRRLALMSFELGCKMREKSCEGDLRASRTNSQGSFAQLSLILATTEASPPRWVPCPPSSSLSRLRCGAACLAASSSRFPPCRSLGYDRHARFFFFL